MGMRAAAPVADKEDRASLRQQAEALNDQAWDLRLTDPRQALALTQTALALLPSAESGIGPSERRPEPCAPRHIAVQARTRLILGVCHYRLSDYDAALRQSEEALCLYERLCEGREGVALRDAAQEGRAQALNTIGNVHHARADFGKALESHEKSLCIKEARGDAQGRAISLNNIGNAYHELGDYARALAHHLQSLQIREEIGDRYGQQTSLNNLGRVYHLLGQPEQARDYYEKSYRLGEETGDRSSQALALNNLGILSSQASDHRTALEFYSRSLALYEELGDLSGVAGILSDIGCAHAHLGDVAAGLECQRRSQQMCEQIGDRVRLVIALHNQAAALADLERQPEALDCFQRARTIAEEIGAKRLLSETHHAVSEAYERAGDLARALEHLKRYHALKEETHNEEAAQKVRHLQVLHEVEKARKEAEIYRLRNAELARVNEELSAVTAALEQSARTDGLTGLLNRRHLDLALERAFEEARQGGRLLALALGDIDHFKEINDRFSSHTVGDDVLKTVAAILQRCCREGDIVARYGGEEFALVLPGADVTAAAAVCERIRRAVAAHRWSILHPDLRVTISFGLTDVAAASSTAEALVAADARLYQAKRGGRNRVC